MSVGLPRLYVASRALSRPCVVVVSGKHALVFRSRLMNYFTRTSVL